MDREQAGELRVWTVDLGGSLKSIEGAKLAVTDINEASAKETVVGLPGAGHQAFANDVSSGASVVETFAAIDAAFGKVDILVNGRLVARGEVLVLNDNFCVRVAEILAPDR